MRLFVANPTRQNQVVCYRLDINAEGIANELRRFQPARQQDIPPGRQVQLGPDMHIRQIEDIVEQLQPYGMIGVVDVGKVKPTDLSNLRAAVVPYVFNVDKPVPADAMRKVMDHNAGILVRDGQLRRQKAAVASSEIIQQTVHQQFAQQAIPAEPSTDQTISFEQDEQTEMGEDPIAEGYKIDPKAPPPRGAKGGRGYGRRR